MMPRFLLSVCFVLLLSLPAWGAIEVSAPGQQQIPLAMTSLLPIGGSNDPALVKEFKQVLSWDLELTGLFSPVDPRAFLADAGKLGLLSIDVDFAEWRMLGAEMLIKGGYSLRGGQLVVEARLYDVRARHLLNGRRYVGKPGDVRRIAHAFADQILKSLTGNLGPFSSRIAYISDQSGRKELYLMEVDGHKPVRATNHRSIVLNPDFSTDGRKIIFTSYLDGNPNLYQRDIFNGKESRLSARKGLNVGGRFAPQGGAIALTLSKDGNSEIYLIDAKGKIDKRLTRYWGIDIDPSWSPDGRQLAFVSNRRGNPNVFILPASGGDPQRLTLNGKYNVTPAWSPKGDWIAFSRKEGLFDIYLIRPDGSEERRLTFGPGNKEHPRFSPDGRFLIYSSDESGKKAIYIMRLDGTGAVRVSGGRGNCNHPAWSPRW